MPKQKLDYALNDNKKLRGIYGYFDTDRNEIVYIGKDSNITKKERHISHFKPSQYNVQHINKVLQNNPNRYIYKEIYICPPYLTDDDFNGLERWYIQSINPLFNFTEGGDGISGYRHTIETKKRLSEINKGKKHSKESIEKMRKSKKGKNHPMYNTPHTIEHRLKISKSLNTTGIYRVNKCKCRCCKQGFNYVYHYIEDGKRKSISAVDLETLKEKVIIRGLEWIKL